MKALTRLRSPAPSPYLELSNDIQSKNCCRSATRLSAMVRRHYRTEVNACPLKVQQRKRSATLAKLGEIKLKQVPQLNTANSSPLIRKHKEVLNLMMRTLSLDTYGLTWAQFVKGFGCGGLAVWLLMH